MSEVGDKFAVYFSHSWRPQDADLGVRVWSKLADSCELLVDVPEEAGPDPPYYVNRIEELLRQSDLFVCVLTKRDVAAAAEHGAGERQGDGALSCSAYGLFEIRLSERFDIPRLVLYEQGTGFKAPRRGRPQQAYIAFNRGQDEALPDERYWRKTVLPRIVAWLKWVRENRTPRSAEPNSLAVSLFSDSEPDAVEVKKHLEEQLLAAGYERVAMQAAFRTNMELFQLLRYTGLVVMELGSDDPVMNQLNAVSHTLCIPAIRMMRGGGELPWLLQGHPGGYQHDIVRWNEPAELPTLIEPRASAMLRISHALSDKEARRYLESKRYSQDFVFISHNLKPPNRDLVERIYARLGEHFLSPFEYHIDNQAGTRWEDQLDEQLRKTTHFVALLTEGYEQSKTCTYELDEILKRGAEVKILPFMAQGRSVPHPKLGELHHGLLDRGKPDEDAEAVVEQVMNILAKRD